MPRYFVHFSFLFFILVGISGLWMRIFPFYPNQTIPFTNLLHGHSHLAFLGWVFLGMFVIFLKLYWSNIKQKKQAIVLTITLIITSIIMFIAFLSEGYALFSIIMSTAHIFVEYWVAFFIYKQISKRRTLPKVGSLFIKGALLALIISSIGPFSLGYIAANGLQDSAIFEMTIYFYLHFQYNGWFFLFLIGLFIIILKRNNIQMNEKLLSSAFWLYLIMLFPGYFHSILWVDLNNIFHIFSTIGSIGQWIAIVMMFLALQGSWKQIRTHCSEFMVISLTIVFIFLLLKHTLELGLILPNLAELVYNTRSIVIGYLHFTLLGFVSFFILLQFRMTGIIQETNLFKTGLFIFFTGFIVNEILLFTNGLTEWLSFSTIPLFLEGLFFASCLLVVGIVIIWVSYSRKYVKLTHQLKWR